MQKGIKMQLNIILNWRIESLIIVESFAYIPILAPKLSTKLWLRIFLHNTILLNELVTLLNELIILLILKQLIILLIHLLILLFRLLILLIHIVI